MTLLTINNLKKKSNQNISRHRKKKTTAYIQFLATASLVFFCLFIWRWYNIQFKLNDTKDASLFRDMNNLPISNKRFINLARHLSPAHVRFGGTSADCLFFNQSPSSTFRVARNPMNGEDISNFTITEKDFSSLYEFSRTSNLRMLFDLNVLIRNTDGSWNDSNTRKIIEFAKNHEMSLDWHLGNEPNSFPRVFNVEVTAQQLAKDYCDLRSLLKTSGFEDSLLVGPEVNQVGGSCHQGEIYTREFLKNAENSVDFVTWHQYYLRGEDAQVKDFINASVFNYLSPSIKSMEEAVISSGRTIPMWLSETSTAYDAGTPGITDRYVAGFLWLDKLGYSAKTGIQVVIRQSFFGGNYALISSDLEPNPDWWVSVIFKEFVSNRVLNLSVPENSGNLRLYAHCTSEKVLLHRRKAITIFGVNIDQNSVWISIQGIPAHSKSAIFVYILTSDDLQSRSIQMNGEVLKLFSNGDLPQFKPIVFRSGEVIEIPAYSMVFIIVRNANVPDC